MYGLSAKKVAVSGARFDFTFPLDSAIPTFEQPKSLVLIKKVPLLLRFKLRTMEESSQFEAEISFRGHSARNN